MTLMGRTSAAGAMLGLAIAVCSAATAQGVDLSGKWSLSGQMIAGRAFMSFAQICDLKQIGDQLAGPRRGPNGGCSAVGVVNGGNIDLTCRTSFTNAPNLAGVSIFHGAAGQDQIFRGSYSLSRFPGANGVFFMMRV
jgi:hypothetical protein